MSDIIYFEDAPLWLRCVRRLWFPWYVIRATWSIGLWWITGASLKLTLEHPYPHDWLAGMSRWEVTCQAWRTWMAIYRVMKLKVRGIPLDEAMRKLRERNTN